MLLDVRIDLGPSLILLVLLLCPALARADEKASLEIFADARRDPYSASGRGRMERAITLLSKDGNVESIRALGVFLQGTFLDAAQLLLDLREIQRVGRVAHDDAGRIGRELEHLRQRERAGATGLGPQIAKREELVVTNARVLEEAKAKTARVERVLDVIDRQRLVTAEACTTILVRADPKAFPRTIAALRSTLVVDQRGPSLFLVHALRRSKRVEASAALLEVFSHPKTLVQVKVEAGCAIATLGDKSSMRELVKRLARVKSLDKNSPGQKRVLHALSRAAGKKLATLDEASTWLA